MNYTPKPIDTTDINLSAELLELTEKIAENVHDVWTVGRIAEGWTYGPVRDDTKKETPALFPMQSFQRVKKSMIGIQHLKL